MPARLLVALSPTGGGGLERSTLTLLHGFDRSVIEPSVVLTHSPGNNASFLAQLPADVDVTALGKRGFIDQLRIIRELRALYNTVKPDVVMGRGTYANVIALLARRGAGHVPAMMVTEHATPALLNAWRTRWLRWAGRWLYPGAESVVTVSSGMRAVVGNAFGVPETRIGFIHNGFPEQLDRIIAEHAESGARLGPPFGEGAPVIVFVGRLTSEKGVADLIRAVALLGTARALRLLVIGTGPLLASLAELARDLGIEHLVTFAGHRPHPWPEMAAADVVVAPSHSEAFSVMLLEATRTGAAIVATDCDWGPREVLTHERDGLLVPVGDSVALAAAIGRLLDDPALAMRLRAAARATSEGFTPQRTVDAVTRS